MSVRRTGFPIFSAGGVLIADRALTVTGDSDDTAPVLVGDGGELGYAEITSSFGGAGQAAGFADVPGLSITVTCDGATPIELEFWGFCQKLANAGAMYVALYENTTLLASGVATGGANDQFSISARTRLIPSAGSHTYKVRAGASSTGHTILASAAGGSYGPAFIGAVSR